MKQKYPTAKPYAPAVAAAISVFGLGAFPQLKMHDPIPLLTERFLPGAGWAELLLLALYAGWLTRRLLTTVHTGRLRRTVWTAFSLFFFLQAFLGICGLHQFLMTGTLHLPVPAMMIAGPVYRGNFPLFMPMLLGATLLVAGPAWCSWFCYFGSWDNLSAQRAQKTGPALNHPFYIRLGILTLVVISSLLLRRSGVPPVAAATAGILFGTTGIAVMVFFSRKRGVMLHCTGFCPIGLITTILGKINPFRITLRSSCTECQTCVTACRYGALTVKTISRRSPGLTCTLCGDCLNVCPGDHISCRFPGLSPRSARTLFIIIVVVIHTLFVGFGRI